MDREKYNACMVPFISGGHKDRAQRRLDFCIGAKVCSNKAKTPEEAKQICQSLPPKEPREPKPKTKPKAKIPEPAGPQAPGNFIDTFTCPIQHLKSVEDWMLEPGTDDDCRPCHLAPLTSWYIEALEREMPSLSNKLRRAFEAGDHLTISRELDYAKSIVGEPLRVKLEKFDCLCQTSKQEDAPPRR